MDKSSSKRKRASKAVKEELSETVREESRVNAVGRAEMEHVSKRARMNNEGKR